MDEGKKETTLKDIVSRESANNEEVIKDEVAALRQRIDQDKREIERLKRLNVLKKRAIIILSVLSVLLCVVIAAMLINYVTYHTEQPKNDTVTMTQTLSETVSESKPEPKKPEKNSPEYYYNLALKYLSGLDGYKKDAKQAAELFAMSAEGGYVKAMLSLAGLYERGENGIDKNNSVAFRYYFMAARQGDKEGLYRVGRFYYYGMGVDKNLDKSLMYLEKSAQQDYEPAQKMIDAIHTEQQTAKSSANPTSTAHKPSVTSDTTKNK